MHFSCPSTFPIYASNDVIPFSKENSHPFFIQKGLRKIFDKSIRHLSPSSSSRYVSVRNLVSPARALDL